MYSRMIKNDILKNKTMNIAMAAFVAISAMLVALACILTVNLVGAVDSLMLQSKTTHFMQMHQGEIDVLRLNTFAKQHDNVDEFQVLEFLNIDGSQIQFPNTTLGNNMQDNGLSVQSEKFDYLLDLDGKIIKVSDGEIYVPVCYLLDQSTKLHDTVRIYGKEFIVAGFLRDSQMNSSLSSSKRFLVSEKDFVAIEKFGSMEYLIEFRLHDVSAMSAFETSYASAGLSSNGPSVTYGLFKTMNGFSDGMMIALILMVSILVVGIACICIRFTLLAKLEDDDHAIGVMKAVGMRSSHIKRVYLMKYMVIALIGCVLGYGSSLIFQEPLSENIRIYMGESSLSSLGTILGILGVFFVFLTIVCYVYRVLHRIDKVSAVEAIRYGLRQDERTGSRGFYLSQRKRLSSNTFLGMKDVMVRKSLYMTMLSVIVIACFIMIVPQNLYNTISKKSFSTYMGIGNSDIRIDIQQIDNISDRADEMITAMRKDPTFINIAVLTTKRFQISKDEFLKIELGDHSIFPVAYVSGNMPTREQEIALSEMAADEQSLRIGDSLSLYIHGREKVMIVCGIYSDITNGGKTAKATFSDSTTDAMWININASLFDTTKTKEKVQEYANRFSFAKVSSMSDYISQVFGQSIRSIQTISNIAMLVALMITTLVTILFMKMLIVKDKYSIAILKSLGFTKRDIRKQYLVRTLVVLVLGIVLGTLLANTLGESLGGMIISSFGASSFKFMVNPMIAYVWCPLMMIIAVLLGVMFATKDIEQIKISENIKE